MPRQARIKGEFSSYHIIQRGNDKKEIFMSDNDNNDRPQNKDLSLLILLIINVIKCNKNPPFLTLERKDRPSVGHKGDFRIRWA